MGVAARVERMVEVDIIMHLHSAGSYLNTFDCFFQETSKGRVVKERIIGWRRWLYWRCRMGTPIIRTVWVRLRGAEKCLTGELPYKDVDNRS